MENLFILFVFLTLYPYVFYPAVVYVFSRLIGRHWKTGQIQPAVTVLVSAYNEEKVISDKIKNTLALDYPPDKLEVLVSSDGCSDRTNDIVAGLTDARVVLLEHPRIGKSACLNKSVPVAKGDIILFTDANAMFPEDLLLRIVRNFNDPDIGLATGSTLYKTGADGRASADAYGKLERWTKYGESRISSCVGADGAVFAIRKELYRPLKNDDINDFIIPLNIIRLGRRVVMDPDVFCIEDATNETQNAFRRQVRITTRTLWAIRRNLEFLNPLKYRFFSFFIFSHKLLRFSVPFFFAGAFAVNLFLLTRSFVYTLSMLGFILVFITGMLNITGHVRGKMSSICKYFLITITAQFFGWIRMLAGIKDALWTPQREG